MQLSPHFTLAEFTRSNTAARRGLDNSPSNVILHRLILLADRMEKVRQIVGAPIIVFSAYRSPAVNDAVGGSKTSDHKNGLAVDFKVQGQSIAETIAKIKQSDFEFDQLIDEFNSWVHIGFGLRMRNQVLIARKRDGKTVYKSG